MLYTANVAALLVIFLVGAKLIFMPLIAKFIWEDTYKNLVHACDTAMREHLIAKNNSRLNANSNTDRILLSAEIQLLDCHEYDVLRKRLLVWGLRESELGQFGLEAIEETAGDIRRYVEIHEIRY